MNNRLIALLKNNMGKPVTSDLASFICKVADEKTILVPRETIDKVKPSDYEGFIFSVERMEDVMEEMKPLHKAHWDETEKHRSNLTLDPDYGYFIACEQQGEYILFTIRKDGKLVGNCAMYLYGSKHAHVLEASEDTLYLLPEARVKAVAKNFIKYWENALEQIGVRQINVSVKIVNKAGRFFRICGYKLTGNELTKMLGDN